MRDIKVKIWIEENGEVLFGEGRRQLLEAINEFGSISRAAKHLKISYRAAWGRLKASEERMGINLILKKVGRNGNKSTTLTEAGKKWLEKFKKLEKCIQDCTENLNNQFQDFEISVEID